MKYAGVHIHVILTVEEPAFRFLQTDGAGIFPGVPVVFSWIGELSPAELGRNATGSGSGPTPDER